MAQRVTDKDLENLVDRINEAVNGTAEQWNENGAVVGAYALSRAYGGVCLEQYMSTGATVRTISHHGYGTKREMLTFLKGMLAGLEAMEDKDGR